MATLLTTDRVSLAPAGVGLEFTGFVIISPPQSRPTVGSCEGGRRILLVEVIAGQPGTQYLYEQGEVLTTATGTLLDGDRYRLGYIAGPIETLKANVDCYSLGCRACKYVVNIAGSVQVADLLSLAGVSRTPYVPPADTTAPIVRVLSGASEPVPDTSAPVMQIIGGEVI